MLGSTVDSWLARYSARQRKAAPGVALPTRDVETPVGPVRVYDSGSEKPCVVLVPDGPNVIEHYEHLISLLAPNLRVVCFDMPGFGHSVPRSSYGHSLDEGARAVIGVLDRLGIQRATLALSCANGFYALRAAQIAPERVSNLVLSQTPSIAAMRAWIGRNISSPLRVPVVGQVLAWTVRRKVAGGWYQVALPRTSEPGPFRDKALDALAKGACFCLAGIVQGLSREHDAALNDTMTPLVMIWGMKDRSHKHTDPTSLQACAPRAEILQFEDCGHFPDVEQPARFAAILLERARRHA